MTYRHTFVFFSMLLLTFCKAPNHHADKNGVPDLHQEPLSNVLTTENPSFKLLPLNPRFAQPTPQQDTKGHALGWAEPPVDMRDVLRKEYQQASSRAIRPDAVDTAAVAEILPVKYDARSVGKVSTIKDQGQVGTCWAHAAIAALEATEMPDKQPDYSENHMAKNHGFDLGVNQGGNFNMAAAYLTRWSGPVSEEDDPYNEFGPSRGLNLPVQRHVQSYSTLIHFHDSLSNLLPVKKAIKNYGTVFTTIYWDNTYYRADTAAFFNGGLSSANHAVALVGWDDTYPAGNFVRTPKWDGAFLVKNSWGTGFGLNGFFWVSYADVSLGLSGDAMFDPEEATNNYSKVYEYDQYGASRNFFLSDAKQKIRLANKFTAQEDASIAAVAFDNAGPFETYQVSVYLSPTSTPDSGRMVSTIHADFSYAGYHTVKIDPTVPITAGTSFTVVVEKQPKKFLSTIIPVEAPVSGYSSQATAAPGQSFFSSDDGPWYDLTAQNKMASANLLIKAYTKGKAPKPISTQPTSNATNVDVMDPIFVQYDKSINKGSKFDLITLNGAVVAATIDGDKLVITPSSQLAWGSTYKLVVPLGAVTDSLGISAEESQVSFSTAKIAKMNLLSTIPVNNTTGVPLDQIFSLTFDQHILAGQNLKNIAMTNGGVKPSIKDQMLTLTPKGPLLYRTKYILTAPEGAVRDKTGAINRATSLAFVTMDPPALKAVTLSPADHQENVPLKSNVKITYNLAVKAGNVTAIEFTSSQGQMVEFTAKFSEKLLTITPKVKLAANTTYSVRLPPTAVLTDPFGEAAAEATTLVFTTGKN